MSKKLKSIPDTLRFLANFFVFSSQSILFLHNFLEFCHIQ